MPAHNKLEIILDDKTLLVLINDTDKTINCSTSIKKLSKAGIEISSIIQKDSREEFYSSIANFFKSKGISHVYKHEIIEYGESCRYKTIGIELPLR